MRSARAPLLLCVAALWSAASAQLGPELRDAADTGNVALIRQLLAQGADVNAASSATGWTPLMLAVYKNRVEAARLLLDNGADARLRNRDGQTALDLANLFSSIDPQLKALLQSAVQGTYARRPTQVVAVTPRSAVATPAPAPVAPTTGPVPAPARPAQEPVVGPAVPAATGVRPAPGRYQATVTNQKGQRIMFTVNAAGELADVRWEGTYRCKSGRSRTEGYTAPGTLPVANGVFNGALNEPKGRMWFGLTGSFTAPGKVSGMLRVAYAGGECDTFRMEFTATRV
ncbi:hypothetical protein Dcar01_02727 [Deinococcus carri]|uniref:Ankyrin repeat domain-containing protein n=1 Tax=Deinococcus carri TaxID=1211323 RepID=A0ABP9WBM3_9DEIO